MSDRHLANGSDNMAPAVPYQDANVDHVINEYMERLGTRLNILETELKYAWRALDLLSQEYIKMWERLEKLEGLLFEQQSVISQLLNFYTSGGAAHRSGATVSMLEGRLGELEVIREILGNGAVEDGLEEGLDVTRTHEPQIQEIDEMHVPDEAFYRSLNQAYEEELVSCDPVCQPSQLDMIWEEREEAEEMEKNKTPLDEEEEEIYSALDYKDYRGNSSCVSEQDIAELTRIDSIDHMAIEKLNELDRLSNKLQQDSVNIKQLQRKLLESPISLAGISEEPSRTQVEDENWSFSSNVRDQNELMMLAKTELSNTSYTTRPSSRLSISDPDKEVAETLAGGMRTPTSPRRRQVESVNSEPFSTVDGRLAYSAAVQHVESAEAAAAAAAIRNSKNPFYCSNLDLNELISASYDTVPCSTPNIFHIMSEKASSPTLSICSVRTRQDGYLEPKKPSRQSPSPPPPAPGGVFLNNASNNVFLGPGDSSTSNQEHLGPMPHSPRSPKSSPKRSKSHSSNIVAAKSDSGLSSMSGWSSLEKSPGSPKNGVVKPYGYFAFNNRPSSPGAGGSPGKSRGYAESSVDSKITSNTHLSTNEILPGGHHLSAFTNVKSPGNIQLDSYGTFVPAPAPASDINVSPNRNTLAEAQSTAYNPIQGYMYQNDQPAIYSVAGSNNKDSYTSVYTSNSADYINQTIHYPDLVEPYENNEFFTAQQRQYYNTLSTSSSSAPDQNQSRRNSHSRSHSTSKPPENIANHDGYRTAMYRTMFPTGNITDALSYYPTSSRYDSAMNNLPPGNFNDPGAWLNCPPEASYPDTASTSSSMKSAETSETGYAQSPYMDRRNQQAIQNQPIYENQQQIEQHQRSWNQRQDASRLDLDLRNRNVPEYIVHPQQSGNAYYEATGAIMTQSGYITITNNQTQTREEKGKKLKRGNTLKSAMNSVSNWFPDLHLTKRHRSYSLPGGTKKDETDKGRNTSGKPHGARKKKRNAIVSTVSGILQKAKRKSVGSHHSLSDPEQSENEWVIKRASSVVSEDDRSEDSTSISENIFERDLFPKISPKSKSRKSSKSDEEAQNAQLQPIFEPVKTSPKEYLPELQQDVQQHEEDHSGKSTGSGSSNIFSTVGEAKRSSGSSEKSDETVITENKMVVVVGGASMEFAVSRALGRYRQKHSNSISEDQIADNTENNVKIEEIPDETEKPEIKPPPENTPHIIEQKSVESTGSIDNNKYEEPSIEGSPILRATINRYLPRHQQSLEIPSHRGDDEDSRSTHSWRSTSRVSSRRQSTEDSIDSEDEWYCYELRKLEEMERQTHLEVEMGSTLHEVPEPEEERYEPEEEVKEKMSFVLRELRMKAKVVEGVLDEKENNLLAVNSAKKREHRGSFHLDEAAALFEKIKVYHHESLEQEKLEQPPIEEPSVMTPEPEVRDYDRLEEPPKDEDEGGSSGATSGPDSPHQSTDEYDELEMRINDEFARCHISQEEQQERMNRETMQHHESKDYEKDDQSIPQIQVASATPSKEEAPKEASKETPGSKWKLLKTLKEKKAEEKSVQGKPVVEPAVAPKEEKVSMLGMVKSFYEIHVKT